MRISRGHSRARQNKRYLDEQVIGIDEAAKAVGISGKTLFRWNYQRAASNETTRGLARYRALDITARRMLFIRVE